MLWLEKKSRSRRYADDENEASAGLIESKSQASSADIQHEYGLSRTILIAILITSNIFWAACLLTIYSKYSSLSTSIAEYHESDFVSPNPLPFEPITIDFDDILLYNKTSHEVYRQMDKSLPLFFGQPSPEIDAAWEHLLRLEYPAISQEEINMNPYLNFGTHDKHPVTGEYHVALDVFHNLHCLNAVRKELDKDYYGHHQHGALGPAAFKHQPQSSVDAAQRDHIDHCMNHIRQALQCRPDLSPAAMHVFTDTDGSQFFLGNAQRHSCYNWDSIMDWAEARVDNLGYTPTVG